MSRNHRIFYNGRANVRFRGGKRRLVHRSYEFLNDIRSTLAVAAETRAAAENGNGQESSFGV